MATGKAIGPITNIEDPRYVKALAHPLRMRLLALLGERDSSPVQLAQHVDATLGTVAYHVRTLERLGVIEMVATHQRRGATEHVYAAREHPRFSDSAWSATSPIAKHVMIASILSQLGQYVTQVGEIEARTKKRIQRTGRAGLRRRPGDPVLRGGAVLRRARLRRQA